MTTQSLAVKLISSVITFYLEVWLLRRTPLVRRLFYSSRDEEEGVPSTNCKSLCSLGRLWALTHRGAPEVPPIPGAKRSSTEQWA